MNIPIYYLPIFTTILIVIVFWFLKRQKKKVITTYFHNEYLKLKGTKEQIKEQELKLAKPYNFVEDVIKKNISFFNVKQRWIASAKPNAVIMVNMELNNGDFVQFLVDNTAGYFKYKGGVYTFDETLKYYIISCKLWCQDYHEGYSAPIKRKIDIGAIKKALHNNQNFPDYAINPISLQKWVTSSAIQLILAGGKFLDWMRRQQILMVISLIVQGISLILLFKISGIHFGK